MKFRFPRKFGACPLWLAIAGLLTLVFAIFAVLKIPTVQRQSLWFWGFHEHPGMLGAALLFIAGLIATRVLREAADPKETGIGAIFSFGLLLQYALSFAEERGLRGLRDSYLHRDHSQFAGLATDTQNAWELITNYDHIVLDRNLVLPASSPPGTEIIYLAFDRLNRLAGGRWLDWVPEDGVPRSLLRAANIACIVLPILSMLTVVPVYRITKHLTGDESAGKIAALVFVVTPSLQLIPLHIDQAVLPIFAAFVCFLALLAAEARGWRALAWSAGTGAVFWAGLFVSFSLLPIVPLAVVLYLLQERATRAEQWRRLIFAAISGAIAFALLQTLAHVFLHYDFIARYKHAMAESVHFKGWDWSLKTVFKTALLDATEYVYTIGIPMTVALGLAAYRGLPLLRASRHLAVWRKDPASRSALFAAATVLILIFLCFFSRTKAEVARLWLPVLPAVAISAAASLTPARSRKGLISCYVAVQLAWMFILKTQVDFW